MSVVQNTLLCKKHTLHCKCIYIENKNCCWITPIHQIVKGRSRMVYQLVFTNSQPLFQPLYEIVAKCSGFKSELKTLQKPFRHNMNTKFQKIKV